MRTAPIAITMASRAKANSNGPTATSRPGRSLPASPAGGPVWLYGVEVGPNPFVMGQEIDIFEDFNKPKKKLDFAHNVHFDSMLPYAPDDKRHLGKLDGSVLYRVSRGTPVLVDDWDAFHVVGVEWTPLEYVFYCDGKEPSDWTTSRRRSPRSPCTCSFPAASASRTRAVTRAITRTASGPTSLPWTTFGFTRRIWGNGKSPR